jgi:PDZ domain-containing secreted protein
MLISHRFNRFFFGVVCKEIKKLPPMKIRFMGEWSMINFRQVKSSSIYQILKQLNKNYPLEDDGIKLSTTKMTSKQMTEHIQWIERVVSWNGHTFDYVSQEWERLLEEYK